MVLFFVQMIFIIRTTASTILGITLIAKKQTSHTMKY